MPEMTEYELHTQGGVIAMSPKHDGRDPMRNRPHSNGTDTTMTIQRYDLGREYAGNTGSPAITEQADGAYVRYEDHRRLEAAHDAHHEMLVLRTKKAESAQPSVPATDWAAVRAAIKEYVADYEMVGESDSAYDPSADERALIEDAIHGLLADNAFMTALRPTPQSDGQAQQDEPCEHSEHVRPSDGVCVECGDVVDPVPAAARKANQAKTGNPVMHTNQSLTAQQDADKVGARHPDDIAVDAFAAVMKIKLAKKRDEGRGGWQDKTQCSAEWLSELLRGHIGKGDPVDVANLAMMLHQRGESITLGNMVSAQPDPAMAGDALRDALKHCEVKQDVEGGAWFNEFALQKLATLLARKRVQPASGEDARDAARWKAFRAAMAAEDMGFLGRVENHIETAIDNNDGAPTEDLIDAAIDAAMQPGGQS